jgi:hypothetical protein
MARRGEEGCIDALPWVSTRANTASTLTHTPCLGCPRLLQVLIGTEIEEGGHSIANAAATIAHTSHCTIAHSSTKPGTHHVRARGVQSRGSTPHLCLFHRCLCLTKARQRETDVAPDPSPMPAGAMCATKPTV